jgi:hypothetical protein
VRATPRLHYGQSMGGHVLASAEASFVTGQTLIVDGGLTITDYPSQPWLEREDTWKLFPHMQPGSA